MVNVTAAVMLRKSKGYCENQRVTAHFTAAPYFGGLGGLQNSPRILYFFGLRPSLQNKVLPKFCFWATLRTRLGRPKTKFHTAPYFVFVFGQR